MSYIGKEPIVGNFQVCDAITVVNGQAAYTLQVSSTNVVPESSQHCLVSLNGILQKNGGSNPSFTVSGSTLTFASNLATGDVIDFVILLGNVLDLGTVSDGTITNAKLAQDIISGEAELTDAPATTDELLISDGGTLKRIDVADLGCTPAFDVYSSDGQTPSDNTVTLIELDGEAFDTDSAFTNTASNYKFTVPSGKQGKYFFAGRVLIDSEEASGVAEGQVFIYKNGSAIAETYCNMSANNPRDVPMDITALLDLSAGDYIQLYAKLNDASGSGLAFKGHGTKRQTSLIGFRLTGT